MMAKKKDDSKLQDILDKFEIVKDYYSDEYARNKEDCAFSLGDQWPAQIKASRQKEKRPCLTENRMLPFINQVVNGIRQSKPSIIVRPVDSESDPKTAKVLRGIIRNIESISDAETAYDTAAYNAVSAGYGWIRIKTDYADYQSFDQEIKIERIMNPFSVYVDPNSTRLDASDAEYMFVFDDMDINDFEAQYPDAATEGFEGDWATGESGAYKTIRVAEYFYKDYESKTLYEYETSQGTQKGFELPEGVEATRERDVEVCTIKYCKVSGVEVLEENEFPSQYIPIIPVIGFETWYEDKRQVFSLIHQAKDPQRMFNYWLTANTEIVALQPKAPFVGPKGTFNSAGQKWANANNTNFSTLEYDLVVGKNGQLAPPPQRQPPPAASPSMMQGALSSADGIKATLGMYDATLGQQTNDISGKAIISRQLQGDNATYHFIDNLSTAMKQVGRVIVDMIPRIYTGPRIVRILGEDGTEEMMPLNQPIVKAEDGYRPASQEDKEVERHQLDLGKYDVIVEVGPSYATKRQEAANSIIELAKLDPRILDVAGDILLKNMDVPDSEELADRIRATMDPALLGDDLEDKRLQQMAEMTQQLQEKLQQTELALQVKEDDQKFKNNLELQKIENDRKKIEIEALKTMAEIEKMQAETNIAIPAEAMNDKSQAIERMQGQVEDLVGAVTGILEDRESEIEERETK